MHDIRTRPATYHRTSHEESSDKTGTKGSSGILSCPTCLVDDFSLCNIVDSHLGSVQDAGSHYIDTDATVETLQSLILIHLSNKCSKRDRFALVCLRKCLEDIERVSEREKQYRIRNLSSTDFEIYDP
jgi:hypothetical protein